jgi:hypothetical protein
MMPVARGSQDAECLQGADNYCSRRCESDHEWKIQTCIWRSKPAYMLVDDLKGSRNECIYDLKYEEYLDEMKGRPSSGVGGRWSKMQDNISDMRDSGLAAVSVAFGRPFPRYRMSMNHKF